MTVPEAAVDEYDFESPSEYEIRPAGEVGGMKSKPEAHPVHKLTNNNLWPSVLGPDPGHILASLRFGEPIGHALALGG